MKNEKNKKKSTSRSSSHSGSRRKKQVVKKKERGIVPYIVTPLIYILIALIVVLPLLIALMNKSVEVVHEAQKVLVADYCDITVSSERYDNNTLPFEKENIGLCEKVGTIRIENCGIESEVYYGVNRVSLRDGVGLSNKSELNGDDSSFNIAGYSVKAFKGLNNAQTGDTIIFETTDRIFEYSVVSNTVGDDSGDILLSDIVLSCDDNSKAFSALNNRIRHVTGVLISVKEKKGA